MEPETRKTISLMPYQDGVADYYLQKMWEKSVYETTGTQTLAVPTENDGTIYPLQPLIPYAKHRLMTKHPVIGIARQLATAPMALADWTLHALPDAPPSALWLIQHEILNRKTQFMERALKDCIDYGFQVNELVFNPDGKNPDGEDAVTIEKWKPLLPYITFLRANPKNGDFDGVKQYDIRSGGVQYIDQGNVQLYNIDVDGTNHYGNSMLDNAEEAFDDWRTTKLISIGYLKKIAGAHWVIYYPPGVTEVDGGMQQNSDIAKSMLSRLEANGGMAIPNDMNDFIYNQNSGGGMRLWSVENITDSGSTSANYIDQLRHFEELMIMALMLPPKAVLESQYGTKAEAVVQTEAAVASGEMIIKRLCRLTNEQSVNRLLELNYGASARDSVWLEVAPITHDNRQFLQEIYTALLNNPDAAYTMLQNLDLANLGTKIGLNNL